MKRWNGVTYNLRTIDVTLLEESDNAEAGRCQVCDRRLPKGLRRAYCLDHSAYAQELIRREHLRRRRTSAA